MGRGRSRITWFDDDDYIGTEVSFEEPAHSTWKLEKKVSENEFYETEEDVKHGVTFSEARAVFFCLRQDDAYPREAVIKIRMQIPWVSTATKSAHVRARQAEEDPTCWTEQEIESLECLTQASCSSTPDLYAYKREKQGANMWIPGGHIVYILMQKLPGIPLRSFFRDLDRQERDLCRSSFKEAWLDCVASGIVNLDSSCRNLLWDRKEKKCYIIDFEQSRHSRDKDTWGDHRWIGWNLARRYDPDHHDLSLWEL